MALCLSEPIYHYRTCRLELSSSVFMEQYRGCIFAGAYNMALRMYFLVKSIWGMLSNRFGHRFFIVLEYTMKTEYQGRATPHWHIAAWVVCPGLLARLDGRSKKIISNFVKLLAIIFQCEIDIYSGTGRLNHPGGRRRR